jgi:signal transduction histidine kinase
VTAIALAIVALGMTRALAGPFAGLIFSVPLVAVVVSGLLGSVGTALLTAGVCAAVMGLFFQTGASGFRIAHDVETYRLVGFLVSGVVSAVISGKVAIAYRRSREAHAEAEQARARAERAVEEARAVGQLQEQLMAIVGHDLRTPLSAIRLTASLMSRRGGLPDWHAHQLQRIAVSAERMGRIILDLIDFSRARRGQSLPVEQVSMDLVDVCRRAVLELQETQPERHISFHCDADSTGRGDPDRLVQVVSNLVGNALQHSAGDTPVEVSVGREGDQLVLAVHNDGPPISPEVLPHLFEPFRRGRSDAEGLRRGSSGLGLFIVREIVNAHGGAVDVKSADGEGTTFTVRLPGPDRRMSMATL